MHPGPILFAKSLAIVFLVQTLGRADDKPNDPVTAFPPLIKPNVPESSALFSRNPIDAFALAVQKTASLSPSDEADRTTLIRRLSFDLLGLPPSPQEVSAFVADTRPDAYERLVDRLLASPAFGERQGKAWLDLARYADSSGFEEDTKRPTAWRYRDWVIHAFNSSMPYDRFVALQLAADESESSRKSPQDLAALGFLRCGPTVGNERTEKARLDELDDMASTTASTFLGLTVGCARCHDHKTDPIPQEDYRRLVAVFAPTRPAELPLATAEQSERHKAATDEAELFQDQVRRIKIEFERGPRQELAEHLRSKLPPAWRQAFEAGTVSRLPNVDREEIARRMAIRESDLVASLGTSDRSIFEELRARIDVWEARKPTPLPTAPGVVESAPRGSITVQPGPPRWVTGSTVDFPPGAGRRSALAAWLVGPARRLAARVMVNRVWLRHFGEGLVRTPSDFGSTGDPTRFPMLLDWLATDFVENGWDLKRLHRLIVTSSIYRQSSHDRPQAKALDPGEGLLWRYSARRLDAESIRDAVLTCSGTLNHAQQGPGVFPPIAPSLIRTGNLPRWPLDATDVFSVRRRSIYLFRLRSLPDPLLEAFDLPDSARPCPRRTLTTVPTQALTMMNGKFTRSQAVFFGDRIVVEGGPTLEGRVDRAFRIATGRPPSEPQRKASLAFLQRPEALADPVEALNDLALTLYNSNSFLFVD